MLFRSLANSFLVFMADDDNKYTVTTGHRSMVVDSLGLDKNPTILDTAVQNEWNDPDVANAIATSEFAPGEFYGYGSTERKREIKKIMGVEHSPEKANKRLYNRMKRRGKKIAKLEEREFTEVLEKLVDVK